MYVFNGLPDTEETVYNPQQHGPIVNGQPEGEGWVLKPSYTVFKTASLNHDSTPQEIFDTLTTKQWVKPSTVPGDTQKSVLWVTGTQENDYDTPSKAFQEAVILHEMGHRVEHVNPKIVKMEEAFLARRTHKNRNQWGENLIPAVGVWNPDEFAHNGNFTSPYVGKEYLNGEHYEVFTTGLEAVLGNNFGGLLGAPTGYGTNKPDEDHRNFIIGLLATA